MENFVGNITFAPETATPPSQFDMVPVKATTEAGKVERLVDVSLSEEDYDSVLSTKQDFGKIVNYLVSSYAKGGIMVTKNKIEYLSELTGLPIAGEIDIIDIVENVTKRNSAAGDLRVVMDVDPAFAPALEELAFAQGRTVNEIVKECCELCLTNSWLYSINLDGGMIPLLSEQRRELERVIGKEITSESLVEWVMDMEKSGVRRKSEKSDKKIVQIAKESANEA